MFVVEPSEAVGRVPQGVADGHAGPNGGDLCLESVHPQSATAVGGLGLQEAQFALQCGELLGLVEDTCRLHWGGVAELVRQRTEPACGRGVD